MRRTGFASIFVLVAISLCGCTLNEGLPSLDTRNVSTAPAARGALLYVSEPYDNAVLMYSYPQLQLVGHISVSSPFGLCVNRRSGAVWVVSGTYPKQFLEFRHGGTHPIKKIGGSEYGVACAVDSGSGDLAVVEDPGHGLRGSIVVYGLKVKAYEDPLIYGYSFVTYDDSGNIFTDAAVGRPPTVIAELRYGKRNFRNFPLRGIRMGAPGALQYSKGFVVIAATHGHVYRTSNGVATGSTTLLGACHIQQFAIDEDHIIVPASCDGSEGALLIYNYPAGGKPIAKIPHIGVPFAAVISR